MYTVLKKYLRNLNNIVIFENIMHTPAWSVPHEILVA